MGVPELLLVIGGGAFLYGGARAFGVELPDLFATGGADAPEAPEAPTPRRTIVTIDDIDTDDPGIQSSVGARIVPVAGYPSYSELEWLTRTMWGEARNQDDLGLRAVGHVIMNRVNARGFGDSVAGVVTAGNGSQFNVWRKSDPNYTRSIEVTPADTNYQRANRIATEILSGRSTDPTGGAVIYFNPSTSTNVGFVNAIFTQVRNGTAQQVTIGDHDFFPGAR